MWKDTAVAHDVRCSAGKCSIPRMTFLSLKFCAQLPKVSFLFNAHLTTPSEESRIWEVQKEKLRTLVRFMHSKTMG